ncbi:MULTISPECIES: cobaltochelatase CobT-related protein [unclassified Desulfovibrio]|uniref:cobaltochelatase CobT-related protein n=1 Tax=unclassified Desulfovibrio TaxID=2593640 RepID=UPI002FD9616C
MIRSKDILNCLPLLASVLGDQYGVQVRIGGREACTNGKIIHLPSLPMDCEPETLALAKGFCDHEAAHIRHTDFGVLNAANLDPVTFNLFNCLEDWRVEKKLSAIFPGCRQNLNWLIRRFFVEQAQPRAGGDPPALAVLDYVLLTVRSWDVDAVNRIRLHAAAILRKQFPGLKETLDAILVKVRIHCPDTAAAIAYARQLSQSIQQWEPQQQAKNDESPAQNDGKKGDGHEIPRKGHASGTDTSIRDNADHSDSASQGDGIDLPACASQAQPFVLAGRAKKQLTALLHAEAQDLPQNLGELLSATLTSQLAESSAESFTVAVEGFRQTGALPEEQKLQALQASIALRTRLQGLLQARTQRRCCIGRRGVLHPGSLYRLQVGNPSVFQKESVHQGLNTAVHILLDVSGSMSGAPIYLAKQACFAVAKALENIQGVNPAVTAFPALAGTSSVFPVMRHGQKVPDCFNISASGGTPLAEALWWVLQTMLPLKEQRKIILIITDGVPDRPQAAVKTLHVVQSLGFEVYGVGIQSDHIALLLPQTNRIINDLPDLAPAMFGLLQQALLKGGKNE